MTTFPWLTVLIVLPLAGAVALCFVKETSVRQITLAITAADLLLSLPLWWLFNSSSGVLVLNVCVPVADSLTVSTSRLLENRANLRCFGITDRCCSSAERRARRAPPVEPQRF